MKLFAQLFLLYFLVYQTSQLVIYPVQINTTSLVIGATPVNYTFTIDRTMSGSGGYISSPVLVPTASNISIIFPSQYNSMSTNYGCQSIIFTQSQVTNRTCTPTSCLKSGSNVTMVGCFSNYTSDANVTGIYITISNITNPSPVMTTSSFIAYVGNDQTSTTEINGVRPFLTLSPDTMSSCSFAFLPTTVSTLSTMIITITPKNPIPASTGSLLLTLPTGGSWSNNLRSTKYINSSNLVCSGTSGSINSALSCSLTNSNTSVSITGLNSTAAITGTIVLTISQILSPPSPALIDSVIIASFWNSTSQLDTCSNTIPGLTANTMGFVITPVNTLYVNQPTQLYFNLTLADDIYVSTSWRFQLIFPSGSIFTFNNISVGSNNFTNFSSTSTTATWTFANSSNSTYLSTIGQMRFSIYTAPPTTLTTAAFTLNILRDDIIVQTGTANLKPVAGNLSASVTSFSPTTVNAISNYTFSITLNDPLLSTGCLRIMLPSTISYTASSCTASGTTGINTSPTCTGNSSMIQICNLSTGSSITAQTTISITVRNITNPSSLQPTNTFTVYSYYNDTTTNNTLVASGTAAAVIATVGTLAVSTAKATPSVSTTSASFVSYSVSFINLNPIPFKGSILIGIPRTITNSSAATCTYFIGSNSSAATQCNLIYNTSGTYYNFTDVASSAIAVGLNITLGLNNVFINPSTVQNTVSFAIQTSDASGYMIDSLTSGIFPTLTASALSVTISRGNTTNSAITPYTFTMNQPPPFQSGAKVIFTFPSTVVLQSPISCTDLSLAALTSCSLDQQTVTVVLLSNASNTNFGVIITNIKNPPSFKPSDNFTIITQTATSLTHSSSSSRSITNTITSTITSLTSTFNPATLATATTMTLSLTPTATASTIKITLAESFNLSANTLSCTPTCNRVGFVITIDGTFPSTSATSITINGFSSPSTTPTDQTSVATFDSGGFAIDDNPKSIQFATSCQYPCKTCSGATNNCTSCYDSTVSQFSYYNSVNHTCVSVCPTGYYANGQNCTACSVLCTTCSGTSSNCTSCSSTSQYPYLKIESGSGTCLALCPSGMYPNNSTTQSQCLNCSSPCATCNSSTICLTCISGNFLYNNTCNTSCPANKTTIPNSFSNTCDPCISDCVTCQNTTSTCLSCPSTGGFVLYQSSCITTCPYPMIKYLGTCYNCNESCATCESIPTNCTSCSIGYLFNNRCISVCPAGYAGVNNVCAQCEPICKTCSETISTCTSCYAQYYYVPSLYTCVTQCPTGLYLNVSNNNCVPCAAPCYTCTDSPTTCATCIAGFLMLGNQCIETCPSGLVSNGTHCVTSTQKQVDKTLNSKIFPLPFTIAGTIVIMTTAISKFQNSNTFFSGATYSLLSLIQWGALAAFLTLYYFWVHSFSIVMIVLIGVFAILYIINLIALVVYCTVFSRDKEFQIWKDRKCTAKALLAISYIFSILFSFKFMNFIFCRIYNFYACKAKFQNISKFFSFNFLIFLSTPFSVGAVCVAAYHAYTSSEVINQLYLQAIDLIIVVVFTFIFGIATTHKTDDFFEEKTPDFTLGKKAHDNDDFSNLSQPLKQYGGSNQKGGRGSKYQLFNDGDISQPSMMDLRGADVTDFEQDHNTGDQTVGRTGWSRSNRKYLAGNGNKIDEQEEPEVMVSEQNAVEQEEEESIKEKIEESKIEEKEEEAKDESEIEILKEMTSEQIIPQQLQETIKEESKEDIIAFEERDLDSSKNYENLLNRSKDNILRQEVKLNTEVNIDSEDDKEEEVKLQQVAEKNESSQIHNDAIDSNGVVKNKSAVNNSSLLNDKNIINNKSIVSKSNLSKNDNQQIQQEANLVEKMKTQQSVQRKKTQNNFMNQTDNIPDHLQQSEIEGAPKLQTEQNRLNNNSSVVSNRFNQNQHLKKDNIIQSHSQAVEQQQFLEEDIEEEDQGSQNLKSDEADKTIKATMKTKGLDTSKDNYFTDRGEIGARDIISDVESDFKFKTNKIKNEASEEEEGYLKRSEHLKGMQQHKKIDEVEQENQKNALLFQDVDQIDDSLPEGELSIEQHPYHVINVHRRNPNANHANRTLQIERKEQSLDSLANTLTGLGNTTKNKKLPEEEQDNKITQLKSPPKNQAEQGQNKITKHPPVDPMKSLKKEKKRNQLLNSSSEFTESENPYTIPPFLQTQPLGRDNLTQLSKENESSEVKREQPPTKKYKVVYDTSDVMDEESMQFDGIGVSPSDFNHYNQRFIQQEFNYKTSAKPMSKNDVPQKPQIISVKSIDTSKKKKQERSPAAEEQSSMEFSMNHEPKIGKVLIKPMSAIDRAPMLMRGFSSTGTRNKNFEFPTARERRTVEAQSASRERDVRVNRNLEKIYLQRLDGPARGRDK